MLHFSVEKKHTPKFTYRLLKSSVYIINQIRDLTNSYDMPRSRSQWLFLEKTLSLFWSLHSWIDFDLTSHRPGRVAQSVGHLTRKSGVLGLIPGLAIYFRFSFRFFKKGNCQLLAKVCARSTG